MPIVVAAFDALAEPNRRRLLELLLGGERPVGELVEALGLAQPTVSKHLRVLREAGMVTVRPEGTQRLYGLRPDGLRAATAWLAPFREIWADRLDALETHLEEMP